MVLPRARDPNRDKAYEIYKGADGKIDLVEIASQLNISPGTVRGWKSKDRWEQKLNGTLRKNTERSKRKKGGQPGNQNAVGYGAPEGNKNAVTTGEFETLLFDCLEPEERQLAAAVPPDKEQLLLQEIRLLTVREHRMLKRIDLLRTSMDDSGAVSGDETGMTAVGHKKGLEKDKETDLTEYRGKLGQIQNIEDALTRVQARKQAAIDSLHRYGVDDARLEIELMRLDLAARKAGGLDDDEEPEDDGFLAALSGAAEDWTTEKKVENDEEETADI